MSRQDDRRPGNPAADDEERYLRLARQLQHEIDRIVAGDEPVTGADLEGSVLTACGDVARPLLLERLEALSVEEFADFYVRRFGGRELQALLGTLLEIRTAQLERQVRLAALHQESAASRRVRLSRVERDEVLTIGLFQGDTPNKAARRYADDTSVGSLFRRLQVRVVDPERGEVEVLHDTWVAPAFVADQPVPAVPAHSRGRLGVQVVSLDETNFRPEISLHSTLTQHFGDTAPITYPQIVGYVETADGSLLLDG